MSKESIPVELDPSQLFLGTQMDPDQIRMGAAVELAKTMLEKVDMSSFVNTTGDQRTQFVQALAKMAVSTVLSIEHELKIQQGL